MLPRRLSRFILRPMHNALWEKNHLLLFGASLEWLTKGTVDGQQTGMLKRGY